MGPPMKGLTYAEFHVQKDGQAQVIRLDQGKIAAVDSSSITLTENDGSSVTVALDADTRVLTKPGEEASTVEGVPQGGGQLGPPEQEIPRAFEHFHLRSQAGRGSPDGAGLGLAIVRELTEAMGGTVAVENLDGGGACFSIQLPGGYDHCGDAR